MKTKKQIESKIKSLTKKIKDMTFDIDMDNELNRMSDMDQEFIVDEAEAMIKILCWTIDKKYEPISF